MFHRQLRTERYAYKKRIFGIKVNSWISISIIILIALILGSFAMYAHAMDKVNYMYQNEIKTIIPAWKEKQYQIPALDKDITEREMVIGLIKRIWGVDSPTGLRIARCESGYNPKATNYNTDLTIDEGVFQINSIHNIPEMKNPVANISYAHQMYMAQGTGPWKSSESCWK